MRKPASLRAALVTALPYLAQDPDKLRVWIEGGTIAARGTAAQAFEYRYKLNLLFLDFARDLNAAVFPVMLWLRNEQPQLLLDPNSFDKAVEFTVDILSDDLADLHLVLPLTEAVGAKPRPSGGWVLTHFAEPIVPGTEPLAPVDLASVWLEGEEQPLAARPA